MLDNDSRSMSVENTSELLIPTPPRKRGMPHMLLLLLVEPAKATTVNPEG
jgi:hypothetical protein